MNTETPGRGRDLVIGITKVILIPHPLLIQFLQEMYISSSVKMCMHDLMIQKQSKCLLDFDPTHEKDLIFWTLLRTLFRKPKARFNPLERT